MLENNVFSLDEDLALLSQVAVEAGHIALGFFNRKPRVWMKAGDKSPVSEADFAVDRYLQEKLLQARPDYGWISEESADMRQAASYRRSFVVDPIDGTRGFIDGSSQWCISLAVIEAGRPVCGVLECPARQEHYSAHREKSAMMNGILLSAHAPNSDRGDRIFISGSRSLTRNWPQPLVEQLAFAPSIPSLAYRLVLVAKAELDVVMVRPSSHDWDLAAADIILEKSGNRLTTPQAAPVCYGKEPFAHGLLLAGHAIYQEQIVPYL